MKAFLYILGLIIIFISPFLGETQINIKDIFEFSNSSNMVFWDLRVARVILAFFVGGILALSGLIFQIIFKNELITPYTLGIASGTTLFTAIGIILLPTIYIFISSILGSLFTILVLYIISKIINKTSIGSSTNSILLIGIALSYFYASALMLVFYMSSLQENYSIVRFTLGSLDTVGFSNSFVIFFVSIVFYVIIYLYKNKIKLLLISNDMAFLKGLNVDKTNLTLLVVVSLCVGITISFTGPIGFIGLVIPHIVKIIYKKSAEKLFFPTFFFGGVFLVFSDLISRNLNTDSTLPIGVVTAFIGAPFFIYLLIKRDKRIY
ncbi:FecCD family ABC transporter permease [Aliarcobacter butzleri]|jgi:iron complex transport system permease protein|uniref:FecCD family ABC transporter permease n=1 Tax=Aliarcobacter butzleri TaxID=28197 RepID=UPI000F48FC7F|nr:iron ABC transporter permease [Aliarcobacter butzleri]MCG3673717.1 iron ABC transporter permease [Aliarcobacter butzleri]MCG3696581.1 iron ABC transporter permease [Aliarcobacter butzleri]MCG3698465.1 iron ABC transporter permease [Aliarcobacter butzleri]MCT7579031.1 iron ABC transporter permease [Aliarcobacter butzleri]MCT7618896.1 iron ABC transporter permease [Aliarcobacter butzleri]